MSGAAAQAKLDAKVRAVARQLVDASGNGEIVVKRSGEELWTEFRVALNAAEAMASVLAEEEPAK